MPRGRFPLFMITCGGLVCGLVALLIFVTFRHALRERAAVRHEALSEGYWIVKALEVSHRVMQPGHAAAMRTLLQNLTGSYGLCSVLLLDDHTQVLLASEAPLEGTRWPGILDVPREGGRIMTSTSDTMVLAFPASFADAAEAPPDALHHVTWILLELDVSTAASHAHRVFWHAVCVALGAVLLTRRPPAPEIRVNIGINTGQALLGGTMMHGTAGERFTYTASGEVTNLAARLCDLGKRGKVHLSQTTAQLVQEHVQVQGPFAAHLKHVQGTVLVYKLKEHLRRPI